MLGFGRKQQATSAGPQVSARFCTDTFNGKYPHVGLYDCRDARIWVCKPLSGHAIRTSHARLITGCDNATSTVWKDRFLCFWFYIPNTGEGPIQGKTINWEEGQILVRIDPNWDYDRQRLIQSELASQVQENLQRQFAHGQRILEFYHECQLPYPVTSTSSGRRRSTPVSRTSGSKPPREQPREPFFYARRF
jgi:hypothetical protein